MIENDFTKETVENIYFLDSSERFLLSSQINSSKFFDKVGKWYLQTQYGESWPFEKDELDLIVVNDNLNILMNENQEENHLVSFLIF